MYAVLPRGSLVALYQSPATYACRNTHPHTRVHCYIQFIHAHIHAHHNTDIRKHLYIYIYMCIYIYNYIYIIYMWLEGTRNQGRSTLCWIDNMISSEDNDITWTNTIGSNGLWPMTNGHGDHLFLRMVWALGPDDDDDDDDNNVDDTLYRMGLPTYIHSSSPSLIWIN